MFECWHMYYEYFVSTTRTQGARENKHVSDSKTNVEVSNTLARSITSVTPF